MAEDRADGAVGQGEPEGPGRIHRRTSGAYERTWELELLVSGALIYALFQLPGALDDWFWRTAPHQADAVYDAVYFAYFYVKSGVYALAVAFAVHLATRAYWVGLIGLDTAFPDGVRWERVTVGPITRQVYRERQPSLEALIQRVDRFCNIIFSFAFSLVFSILLSLVLIATVWLLSLLLAYFVGERRTMAIFWLVSLLIVLPAVVFAYIDRGMAGRLDPRRGLGRLVYRVTSFAYTVSLGITYRPVFNVLLSNMRQSVAMVGGTAAFVGVFSFTLIDMLRDSGRLSVDGYAYLPGIEDPGAFDYRYYADQWREGEVAGPLPAVQSQSVEEPFVRLFIPYVPRRHPALIERECPGVRPVGSTGLRVVPGSAPVPDPAMVRPFLECMGRLHPITLNGAPLDIPLRLHTDPVTRRRGVVAMIPTAGLPESENLLTVAAVPRRIEDARPPPHRITFWVDRSGE